MSNITRVACSETHRMQVGTHLDELREQDPNHHLTEADAADHLIHLGWMLSRLPEKEILPIIARANEAANAA